MKQLILILTVLLTVTSCAIPYHTEDPFGDDHERCMSKVLYHDNCATSEENEPGDCINRATKNATLICAPWEKDRQ